MKKLFKKVMLFAAAAMAFASCQNDGINDDVNTFSGVEVEVNTTTTDVRSAFGDYNSTDKTYPTLWEGKEAWHIHINNVDAEVANKSITFSEDKKSAKANFTLETAPTAASDGTYTLFALSPASVWSSYDLESDYLRFYIARNTQTPTATSCDPACQVLFAKSEPVQSVDAFTANFEHLSAYVKFSFLNVAEGGVVSNVSVSSEDVNLAGRYQYTPSTGKLTAHDRLEKSITLVTTSTDNLWMAVAPVDVSGKKLTFSITTDKGVLSKEVTMPATAKFESGKIVTFNVDMAGIEYPSADAGEEWYLVTNTADLTDGEYIFVAKNNANNIVYLPNATNTSTAPSQKPITITGLDLSTTDAFKTTLIPEDARFYFSGSASSMTIKNADGKYLYTINNNNGVRIGTTNDTWSFAVHSKNAKAFAIKSASNNRFVSLYNAQDWRSYDSSIGEYPSDKNTQNGVVFLYKKVSYEPAIVADAISVPATYTTGEATYTVKNMEGDDVTATFATEWISTEAANGVITYEIEPNYTGAVRTGKITLSSAKYGITKDVTVTQAADQFKVSATSVSLKSEANSTATFTVTSTYAATIAVADATKWSVTPTSVAGGASAVTVTVKALTANATAEAITGAITITRTEDSKKLTVTASQAGVSQGGSEPVVVLSEQFDNKSTSDSSTAITTSTFSNFSGATDKAYKSQYGGIKLGTSSKVGYITTKSLDLSSAFTVQIDACKYGSDSGNITVTCGSQVKTINNSSLKAAGTFTTFTLEFTAATASSTVKIATSSKRAYIDNVIITRK